MNILDKSEKVKKLWKLESRKALRNSECDPWEEWFQDLTPFRAIRLRYNAAGETWVEDEIQIKLQENTFNEGMKKVTFLC